MQSVFDRRRMAFVLLVPLANLVYHLYQEFSAIPANATLEIMNEIGLMPLWHLISAIALVASIIVLLYDKVEVA